MVYQLSICQFLDKVQHVQLGFKDPQPCELKISFNIKENDYTVILKVQDRVLETGTLSETT